MLKMPVVYFFIDHPIYMRTNVTLQFTNDSIQKIFEYNRWDSIRSLRTLFGYHDLYALFAMRQKSFLAKLPQMGNTTIASLLFCVTLD